MNLSVKFDGHELSDFLTVISGFERGIGTSRDVELLKIGNSRGGSFVSSTKEEAQFSMPFKLRYDLIAKRRALAKILDVKEPKKLVFGDEPDKYYLAIPTGDVNVEENNFLGIGTITWLVPDGLAHSTTIKSFTATTSGGKTTVKIKNEGTEEVPVTFRIKHGNQDNGYVGVVSAHGAMQFGKIDEKDGQTYTANERLINGGIGSWPRYTGQNPQDKVNKSTNGTLSEITSNNRKFLSLTSPGSGGGWWNGGMKMQTIPPDSNGKVGAVNFYAWFRFWFEAGLMGQTGCVNVDFFTADDKLIAGYFVAKDDRSGNTGRCTFYVGGNNPRTVKEWTFTASSKTTENSFDITRGPTDLRKSGDKLTFYYWGVQYTYTVPEIKSWECAKIGLYIGQHNDRALDSTFITRHYLETTNFQFTKVGVSKWRDVPNRYAAGSELVIDGNTTKLYVNGIPAIDDEVKGTQYFKIPPGETTVEFFKSSFGVFDKITAEIREAWV
ncbi:putative phage tail component-like protein [Aequitasia blattaphilus]|uniref:Phage tail family protein n=1 Tax=Aequitasia blattaphilus TaxID=2949332 RepID=A0ABT1E9T4_9FIRM|nr:distal tail protein Dit [Aequitasia blattaphilus]MCP1102598.1 phage tail family protein [Aequitasia blattaphilus]MCR8615238.1 phage tail family protein [Aequitasia blattaphilus]